MKTEGAAVMRFTIFPNDGPVCSLVHTVPNLHLRWGIIPPISLTAEIFSTGGTMLADVLKNCPWAVARLCGVETALCYLLRWEGSGRWIIGGTIPVKKRGPWAHADLRVVTLLRWRSRLGR